MAAWRPDGAATLLRALRTDVALRYVAMGSGLDAPAYELLHEDGAPEDADGVRLIAFFEVPDGGDRRLAEGWERVRALLAARQGYLGSRLYRSTAPADFRFVAVVRWSSPLMYARTLQQPEVTAAAAALPFPFESGLYLEA
jgi:hypothetical protein